MLEWFEFLGKAWKGGLELWYSTQSEDMLALPVMLVLTHEGEAGNGCDFNVGRRGDDSRTLFVV
ncbi:hypothetical protein Pyn_18542 [Prunus yedoensis var. nudiflora]|uniref:Uncharacterized protein n=1 Tax=Prunus yedoensis var. nudiflora TaxID=2094558 RepID=A0A314U981_PRUYE|nr:hypothetical protein Pyn_18542 [Prunus yedoensis var. nudiflora]